MTSLIQKEKIKSYLVLITATPLLFACGVDESSRAEPSGVTSDSTSSPSASPPPTGLQERDKNLLDVVFRNAKPDKNAERVQVDAGEPVTLSITADEPGELHLHLEEELTISYPKGKSIHRFTIERPGLVEVESHDLDLVVFQIVAS